MLSTAVASGMPADQLRRFLAAGYVPQPMQMRAHAAARSCDLPGGPTQVGVGGARGPGKSHGVFAQVALDDCQRVPELKVLYLRKVGKNAREQFGDLRRAVLHSVAHDYNASSGVVTFSNGSRIIVGHFRNESDIDQYLGLEYDIIIIEETTTLSQTKYRALRDSNRTSKAGWRPRIYNTTNPGGIGHAWYRKIFIDPARKHRESDTRFVFGTIDDNKFVDPDYKRKLEENTGWKLRAYRYGDWDIAAGQFFTTWSRDTHVRPAAQVEIQHGWRVWLAMDYGFVHLNVVHLLAESGDGQVFACDEHAERGWLVKRHAEAIKAMLARNGVRVEQLDTFVAGGDVFAKGDDGKTVSQRYADEGFTLKPANTDRIDGAAEVLDRLGDAEANIAPRLVISERCARLIECIPDMQHDPGRPEDVLKVDIDEDGLGGDDAYDCFRYGLMEAAHAPTQVQVAKRR